jgi:hypothetical protein
MDQKDDERVSDDLLISAEAIADEIGLTPQQVYYQYRAGNLPLKKLGALLIASKRALREHFREYLTNKAT